MLLPHFHPRIRSAQSIANPNMDTAMMKRRTPSMENRDTRLRRALKGAGGFPSPEERRTGAFAGRTGLRSGGAATVPPSHTATTRLNTPWATWGPE